MNKAALILVLLFAGTAHAEVSANLGFASEYHYRGIFQVSNSVNGGLDFNKNGGYVGVTVADVKDGLEFDPYFGYRGEIGQFDYNIGYTGYFYTGDFDDTYQEINLGTSYGLLALDIAVGKYDIFDGPKQDYTYYALTLKKNGLYGKYAGFSQDFAGEYFEVGFGTKIVNIDVGIAAIFANDIGSIAAIFANKELLSTSDLSLVLTFSKTFDLS